MKKSFLLVLAALSTATASAQKQFSLSSPTGKIKADITVGKTITYDVNADGRQVMKGSRVGLTLTDGTTWGDNAKLTSSKQKTVSTTVPSPFYRATSISDNYRTIEMKFKGGWGLEFRVYDDGVAYRFVSSKKKPYYVKNETADFRFTSDVTASVPFVRDWADGDFDQQFRNSFENIYTTAPISRLNSRRMMFLPVVADAGNGTKVAITESDLNAYPGMYLLASASDNSLKAKFAPYPKRMEQGGHNNLQMIVKERENYIAKIDGQRTFPWRVAIITTADKDLAASNLSYLLAAPSKVKDTSWIRPGKVAWDWWNDWNIEGVDFKSGVNTATYKYYIDFAAKKGIEYVILDEGWAVNGKADLMKVVPEIDLKEIIDYGKQKNVGIILWAGYWAFDRDMENVCRHYSQMGVKGFKVDFMDRDDQLITAFEHRAAAMCAKYKLVLDLHGSYKPAGMNRTWPNALNFEGVNGLEQMKWSPDTLDQVKYDVMIPFARQIAGPMDYTQGAMHNASRGNYHPCNSEPMSQGTRCRQMALYMVFDSPLNMLCDSPSNYLRETECTDFITSVPTSWDETRVLDAKMGEYIVTARRKGQTWYVGGITDWTARDMTVDLSFLDGQTRAELFRDGVNADRKGSDYKKVTMAVSKGQQLKVHLAPGGGFAMKIQK